jgi:hypothetical protein
MMPPPPLWYATNPSTVRLFCHEDPRGDVVVGQVVAERPEPRRRFRPDVTGGVACAVDGERDGASQFHAPAHSEQEGGEPIAADVGVEVHGGRHAPVDQEVVGAVVRVPPVGLVEGFVGDAVSERDPV